MRRFCAVPRFFEPLPDEEIVIEAPPQKQTRKKQPCCSYWDRR